VACVIRVMLLASVVHDVLVVTSIDDRCCATYVAASVGVTARHCLLVRHCAGIPLFPDISLLVTVTRPSISLFAADGVTT